MELRKQIEIEYYEKRAQEWLESSSKKTEKRDLEGFQPNLLSSFAFCYQWLAKNCKNKRFWIMVAEMEFIQFSLSKWEQRE